MVGRDDRLEGFVVEGLGENARFFKRQRDHDHVQFSALQHGRQIDGQIFFDFERHAGCAFVQKGDQVWQQIRPRRGDHTEPQCADELVLALRGEQFDLIRFFQHALGLVDNLFPERSELDVILPPLENHHSEFILQLLNGQAKSRLGDEYPIRRSAEVVFLRQDHDVVQLRQGHLWLLL